MFKIIQMKNSRAFLDSFVALAFLSVVCSLQLDEFMKAIEDANLKLGFIRQKRSPSIEELLSRFDEDDNQFENSNLEPGDAWYQSFCAMECLHGGCSKRPLRWKTKKAQPDEEYEYYEEEDEDPSLQDQWENTRNDLSHEANYKLSKLEQDAVEKSLPKTAWPVRHQNKKRHVDPMQAVKLKTSLRMLKNGDGATLPSSFLEEDRQKISVEDILANSKHDESPDPWKETYEVVESRKLLSVDDSEVSPSISSDEKICRSKDCLKKVLDFDRFDNLNQKTDQEDRKFAGLYFENTDDKRDSPKKGALATLSDELIHSKAFVKLQNFIKGTNEAGLNKTKSEPKTTTSRPKPSVPLNLVDKDRDVNIKLHMSVNATVLGDAKLPEQFHKNNTLKFAAPTIRNKTTKKGGSMLNEDLDLDRNRRGVVFPILTSSSKRKANEEISKSVIEASDSFPLDEIITGKLTSQLVNTIFSLVKSSPNLKVLWPGLKKNKVTTPKQVQNFYAIRTQDNESEMHRTELMLREAMETINAIIEQQVRSRSCVPLRADLKSFYNLILTTQAENDQMQDRQKRETSSNEVDSMDDLQIRQKSRIIKKLLQDYEELPPEDQDQVGNIKESLLFLAEELKELDEKSRRRKRQLTSHLLRQNTKLIPSSPSDTQFSPQYLKLTKTAEMILHNSLKDSDLTIDFNSI